MLCGGYIHNHYNVTLYHNMGDHMIEPLGKTRKKILDLIADGKAKRIVDIENLTGLNRSGIIRHVNASVKEKLIEKVEQIDGTYRLRITEKGIGKLKRVNFDEIISKSGISDKLCLKILLELTRYHKGVKNSIFFNHLTSLLDVSKHELQQCINGAVKYRMAKKHNDIIILSELACVLLASNKNYSNKLHDRLEAKARDTSNKFKKFFKARGFHVETVSNEKIDGLVQIINKAYQQSLDIVSGYLISKNLSIDDLLKNDDIFNEVEALISTHIKNEVSSYVFGMLADESLKHGLLDIFD